MQKMKKSIYIGDPTGTGKAFRMGRAEAGVTSSIKRSGIDFVTSLPNAKVINFASFVTIYRGDILKKGEKGNTPKS